MANKILGLHHITAIAGNAQQNHDFYTRVLGLRLVKKTVNFDDPGTYHFYFGNEQGSPGTILTFFPWEGIAAGRNGVGMATEIAYTVPEGSLDTWKERFTQYHIAFGAVTERFGDQYLPFTDPDGLQLTLVVPKAGDGRQGYVTPEVGAAIATKGFFNTTLTLNRIEPTAKILTDILGYTQTAQEGSRYRFTTDSVAAAGVIDILVDESGKRGHNTAGTNHHIAFRVKNDELLMDFREQIRSAGHQITPKIDRDYFYSLYFREPGGVLFELATDNPGFTVDEPLAKLGTALKLPKQYEPSRSEIERVLPALQ